MENGILARAAVTHNSVTEIRDGGYIRESETSQNFQRGGVLNG